LLVPEALLVPAGSVGAGLKVGVAVGRGVGLGCRVCFRLEVRLEVRLGSGGDWVLAAALAAVLPAVVAVALAVEPVGVPAVGLAGVDAARGCVGWWLQAAVNRAIASTVTDTRRPDLTVALGVRLMLHLRPGGLHTEAIRMTHVMVEQRRAALGRVAARGAGSGP
jgi:hypothetical protein